MYILSLPYTPRTIRTTHIISFHQPYFPLTNSQAFTSPTHSLSLSTYHHDPSETRTTSIPSINHSPHQLTLQAPTLHPLHTPLTSPSPRPSNPVHTPSTIHAPGSSQNINRSFCNNSPTLTAPLDVRVEGEEYKHADRHGTSTAETSSI